MYDSYLTAVGVPDLGVNVSSNFHPFIYVVDLDMHIVSYLVPYHIEILTGIPLNLMRWMLPLAVPATRCSCK